MIMFKKVPHLIHRFYSVQASLPVPVIKIPKYVEKHVEKAKMRQFIKELNFKKKRRIIYRGNTSTPVISSTHGDYNFYFGQIYNERYPLPLQSKYWFKAKSSGQKFTIHPCNANPSLPSNDQHEYVDDVYFPNEFSKMNLNDNIVNSLLKEFNFDKPTRIQTLAIPRILSRQNVLIATEAGSGKTISYLAPIIQHISLLKQTTTLYPDTPLGLVVTPGRELAEQIADVAFRLGKSSNVDVKVLVADGTTLSHLKFPPNMHVDLLVASVGILVKLFSKLKIKLGNVRHLVFDEADTLLDDSFSQDVDYLVNKMTFQTSSETSSYGTQLVLASSIYPSNVSSIFSEDFTDEDLTELCSPYLHRVPLHIEQRFWRVSNDSRASELLHLVKEDYEKKKPVIIFCNSSPTCDWLSKFLEENGVENAKFHGAVEPKKRSAIFRAFQSGSVNVLCCTDLASRGLDTQRTKHVINFDFPNNVSDYLLRAGRVGRVGSNHGRVTNLVVSRTGVYTVQDVESAVKKTQRISNVDSNIKQKIRKLYFTH